MTPNLLFVYGTLRKGFGNHVMMSGCTFLGDGTIQALLYAHGMLPMIGHGDGTVKGELYKVPDEEWRHLDGLEGHPNWYCREHTNVTLADGKVVRAWAYFMLPQYLKNYTEKSSHMGSASIVESGDYAILRDKWI